MERILTVARSGATTSHTDRVETCAELAARCIGRRAARLARRFGDDQTAGAGATPIPPAWPCVFARPAAAGPGCSTSRSPAAATASRSTSATSSARRAAAVRQHPCGHLSRDLRPGRSRRVALHHRHRSVRQSAVTPLSRSDAAVGGRPLSADRPRTARAIGRARSARSSAAVRLSGAPPGPTDVRRLVARLARVRRATGSSSRCRLSKSSTACG